MFPIGHVDDFSYYQAAEKDILDCLPTIEKKRKLNTEYLESNSIKTPSNKITGSFIYAHPPDYRGRPMLHADIESWRRVFRDFKMRQIDTVIFQAALWAELHECYYKSKYFSSFKTWNVVEPMLKAAQAENIKVFLGGYGSVAGWDVSLNILDIKKQIKLHIECYKELLKWHDLFAGFYFPCETAFKGKRDIVHENNMNCLYGELINELKELTPEKLVLISPASLYYDDMNPFCKSWHNMLYNIKADIIAPQDSIGCCGISLPEQAHMYKLWREVADECNMELWANIELFEGIKINDPEKFITASKARIYTQMNNAIPYVKKLVCWEALFFNIP